MPKSAGINFGIPDSEYIVRVDDTGAATSCYNQDTDTEYVGGGGDTVEIAEVNIINQLGDDIYFPIPNINSEGDLTISISVPGNSNVMANVPVANEGNSIALRGEFIVSVSGDIQTNGNFLSIYGNGSITITDYA